MADGAPPSASRAALSLFPGWILRQVVEDDLFRERLGLDLDGTIVLDGGRANFGRAAFLKAVRDLYRSGSDVGAVHDTDGAEWTIETGRSDGLDILKICNRDATCLLQGLMALNDDPRARLGSFEAALRSAGLGPDALPQWRELLSERPLRDEELRHLDGALAQTPVEVGLSIKRRLSGAEIDLETLAPPHRDYYENLIGAGVASSVAQLAAEIVAPHINRMIALRVPEVTRLTLLLASHTSIIAASELSELPEAELSDLLDWAVAEGDLLSRIGAIEVGLGALKRVLSLEPKVLALVRSILALDHHDVEGRLRFLMAILFYVGGELSRTKVLADLPPFQRRLAIFAQASLFERHAYGHIGVEHFGKWAMAQRGRRFHCQTLIELREEPRWTAEYCAPEQLKAEFLGRISNSANTNRGNVAEGPLHDLLYGGEATNLPRCLTFPGSFLPGPLEGRTGGENPLMPPEWDKILADSLAAEDFGPKSVAALINLRGLFSLADERVARAVELIRSVGHRFPAGVDQEMRENIFIGLAGVTSASRNPSLARELRIMVRKNRIDGRNPPSIQSEFLIACAAAAAHAEFGAWADYLGDWAEELAFQVADKDDAGLLLGDMDLMSSIEPRLRPKLGRAMIALEAWLAA